MDGAQLYNELDQRLHMLDTATSELKKRGNTLAEKERDYRVALAEAILRERADGMPVTIINDVCRGKKDIAQKRLERDIAQTMYDSVREFIMTTKKQIDILNAQIQREWQQAGMK